MFIPPLPTTCTCAHAKRVETLSKPSMCVDGRLTNTHVRTYPCTYPSPNKTDHKFTTARHPRCGSLLVADAQSMHPQADPDDIWTGVAGNASRTRF